MQQDTNDIHASYTKLVDKHYSPMVIRKTTKLGFPIYVALITDDNLSDLDDQMNVYIDEARKGWTDDVQKIRNFAGGFVQHLLEFYPRTEGAAVIVYADKMFVSSLHGDLMTHISCKIELFGLLTMSIGV